jgi:hypothetical protein
MTTFAGLRVIPIERSVMTRLHVNSKQLSHWASAAGNNRAVWCLLLCGIAIPFKPTV